MKREDWVVDDDSIRPISAAEDVCTYCRQARGLQHKPDCVIKQRTVVIEATVQYVISVPEGWDEHQIEFHRNESSLCSWSALVDELSEINERIGKDNCKCSSVEWSYIREADETDEWLSRTFVTGKEPENGNAGT